MVDVHRVVNGTSLDLAPDRDELVYEEARSDMTGAARAGWPDFGHTTMNNNGRRRESVRAGLAGQPASAQVAGKCDTVYGSMIPGGGHFIDGRA
jgi:hypothetical protein